MKRTYWLVRKIDDRQFDAVEKITCEVVGETADGSKVWEDKNGEQYFCFRMLGTYYFVHY